MICQTQPHTVWTDLHYNSYVCRGSKSVHNDYYSSYRSQWVLYFMHQLWYLHSSCWCQITIPTTTWSEVSIMLASPELIGAINLRIKLWCQSEEPLTNTRLWRLMRINITALWWLPHNQPATSLWDICFPHHFQRSVLEEGTLWFSRHDWNEIIQLLI